MNYEIVINEVDCYVGNSLIIPKYATSNSVQHQILLKNKNKLEWIGRLNSVSDDDRGEKIVYNEKIKEKTAIKFLQLKNDKKLTKTQKIEIAKKIFNEINIDCNFDIFCKTLFY